MWYTYNSNEKIIDLSLLSFKKMNYFLEDVKLNKSKKIAATYSERGEISYQLVVLEYGSDSTSYTTDHVRDFFWISDSTLLYTKTDLTERPFQVLKTNVNTKKTDILFSLNDNEKELELTNNKKGTLLKIQNYDDTECLILNTENNIFESRVSKNKETQINLTFFDNKKVIINEIGDTHLLRFGKINAKNYLNLPIIYKSTGIIEEVKNTKDYIIFTERLEGNCHLKTINLKNNTVRTIKNIPKYSSITIDQTTEEKNEILFSVEGALTPYYQIKLNVEFNKLDTTHQDVVSADFNLTDFTYEYTEIAINDSINIPITILYKTELKDSLKGLLIKTYGTYNSFDFPTYNVDQLIYATAGVGVAFVHPRGSGEKGKNWYINGKKMNKKNTFSDYISSVEALKNLYNLKRNQIIGYGSSAGGLTIGVAANLRADLFGGLIFDKPYINIIDVMNNPNLPLTTLEYSEFGNINDTTVYNYVKSYAPLENIKEENYPNILVFRS